MKRSIMRLSLLAVMTTACGKTDDGSARLASSSTAHCNSSQGLNLVAARPSTSKAGEVANPSVYKGESGRPLPGDYLPIVTTDSGEQIIGFPGGTTADGRPIMADEVAVTDLEGYPYKTYQGNQGNCAPRAFEAITGVYNPYLEESLNGSEDLIRVGGRTFINRPNTVKPQVGQVISYRPFENDQSSHAAVVTGYDQNGDVIVATGWERRPYQSVPQEMINASRQEVYIFR
jgi:hypothetical protein